MEIVVGKTAGFCNGVQNAVKRTEKVLKEEKNISCLGNLVHNGEVVRKLKENGLRIIDKIEEAKSNDKIIIRAHGIPKETYREIEKLNIEILDYTCPNVLKIHKLAQKYSNDGYYIFLIAIETHPETIGTISFCGNNASIITTMEDIQEAITSFKNSNIKKLLIIAQTTFSLEKFDIYVKKIKEKINESEIEVQVKNTICNATKIRQKETDEISRNVQYMIIIGGENSSNTRKLYEISKQNCSNVIMIENKEKLDVKRLEKFNKIGIMAGASTPKESINEIIELIRKNQKI